MENGFTALTNPTDCDRPCLVGPERNQRVSCRQLVRSTVASPRVNSTVIWLLSLSGLAYHVSTVKVRDVLKLLRNDGWSLITTAGSHRQLKHPTKPGRVTVSGHPSDDIHPKTLKSILTQAGLKK